MTIRLSKTSKLDDIRSWSLEALETCPGSRNAQGHLVPACQGCYATDGNYRFEKVKSVRRDNQQDWLRAGWVDEMVGLMDSYRYFRWFDSGDVYAIGLARKIRQVMERTPWCKHWLPTRMHKFPKFEAELRKMEALPNVRVRRSSDSISGAFIPGLHGSTIIADDAPVPPGVDVCTAYDRGGKCDGCRACWDKDVAVIAYVGHGRKMISLQGDLIATTAA